MRFYGAIRYFSTALFAATLVWGCAAFPHHPSPRLEPAPYPEYTVGTTFVYSDGARETVTETTSSRVTWADGKGGRFTRFPDFVYRPVQWRTRSRQGTRRFLPKSRETLWPLQKGRSIRYSETGTWVDETGLTRSYRALWTCRVVGTERVSVPAGVFDTWKIVGKRYAVGKETGRGGQREEKSWYYAPEIGHYVLATSRFSDGRPPHRRELIASLPPLERLSADQRYRLERTFQNALEFAESGVSVSWNFTGIRMGGEITAVDTFQIPGGAFCRRYVQKVSIPDGQQSYYGIVCRDPKGRWVIP